MAGFIVNINRDAEGYPSLVTVDYYGKKLEVEYNKDRGFIITGSRRFLPELAEIAKLIFPYQPPPILKIDEPLKVVSVPSGGKIIVFDGIEDSLIKWLIADGQPVRITTEAFSGGACLSFQTAAGAGAAAYKGFGLPVNGIVGLECMFMIDDWTNILDIQWILNHFSGVNRNNMRVKFVKSDLTWYYLDPSNSWRAIPGSTQGSLYRQHAGNFQFWHKFRVVVNLKTCRYLSLRVNEKEWDLKSVGGYVSASATNQFSEVAPAINSEAGLQGKVYYDDFVITEESE